MRPILLRAASLLLLTLFSQVHAKQSDFKQKVDADAKEQFFDLNNGKAILTEQVVIRQGTILIHADKVAVTRKKNGDFKTVTAWGKPATFHQIMDNGKPIDARGNKLFYQVDDHLITLTGDAFAKQLDSEVTGHEIRYRLDKQQVSASSGAGEGRVSTIFIPNQLKQDSKAEHGNSTADK